MTIRHAILDRPARVQWALLGALIAIGLAAMFVLTPILNKAATTTGQRAVFADYLAALVLAIVCATAIAVWPLRPAEKARLLLLWAIKAGITLLLLPVYEAHYYAELDAFSYFRAGALDNEPLPRLTFGAGTVVVPWLVHWATAVLPAYFHLLEMLWSFVGLLAIFAFYRGWRSLVPELDSRFLLWIGLFPDILFWSSILGKDPVCLAGVGLYFCGIARWHATRAIRPLFLAAVGIGIAAAIRPWYVLILVAPLIVFALVGRRVRGWQKFLMLLVFGAGAIYAARWFLLSFNIGDTSQLVAVSNEVSHGWAHGGSAQVTRQFHGVIGMLAFIPAGLFTALFRPLPGEIGNPFAVLAGIDNLALLGLFLLAVKRLPVRVLRRPSLLWAVALVAVWGLMYAFPSMQNLGTAVRFRLQVLPILWPLVLLGSRRHHRHGLVPLRAVGQWVKRGAIDSRDVAVERIV